MNGHILVKLLCAFFLLGIQANATELNVVERKIEVNGREAAVYAITQSDGTMGLTRNKGDDFEVTLKNSIKFPTSVHWHGMLLPNNQDGVAFITQLPIYPGQTYKYNFPIIQSGTYWMHSHYGLEEQKLLSAPLIINDPDDQKLADQDIVLFLTDFSFRSPAEIFYDLRHKSPSAMAGMSMEQGKKDLVDVQYDAFLTNSKTLKDPQIVRVKAGSKVRLRIINGSSATNFFIRLGKLVGEAIAVDGNRIEPIKGSEFELAVAQRIDIIVNIEQEGTFPILAQGEGTDMQTGLILAFQNAQVPDISQKASNQAGALTNALEGKFRALNGLSQKKADKQILVELGGDMQKYEWTINGQSWPEVTPLLVVNGQRIELLFKNTTSMSHPMHLHGHVFQVTSIDGKEVNGAMRDTILVLPNSSIAVQFDANNPGVWPLHCHLLYHLEAGMMTVLRYDNSSETN